MVANGDAKWDILVKGEVEGFRDKEGKLKDNVSLFSVQIGQLAAGYVFIH